MRNRLWIGLVGFLFSCGPTAADIGCENWKQDVRRQKAIADAAQDRHEQALIYIEDKSCAGIPDDRACAENESARVAVIQEQDRLMYLRDQKPEGCS